jgi:hypothetical protein
MSRQQTLRPVARRTRPRHGSNHRRYELLLKHSHIPLSQDHKIHVDDWAMEWLYEDFTLWGEIKLHTNALVRMMQESDILAQFNANTNCRVMQLTTKENPLSYLVNLMTHHQEQHRK